MQKMGKRTNLRGQKTSEIAADTISGCRSKRWRHTRKEEDDNEEVVKYMSKLPGYLQGEESNVLNVGVLDWSRLEKWKHCRAKVSCTSLKTVPKGSSSHRYRHRCKIDDQVHACSLLGKVKASRGLQHSLEPEFSSRDRRSTCTYKESEKSVGESNHHVSNIVLLRSRKQSQVPPRSCPLSFDDSEDMRLPPLGAAKKERFGDQENNRDPSPSKRFSFSFGCLGTSLTFKEDSSAGRQPFTSSDGSACPSKPSNPENLHCGSSRVSPLRRLLDPLLKSKGSENVLPSTPSDPKPTNMDEKKKKKKKQDTFRALFQLTTRNGIPLFQFVVDDDDNSRSILGATMKNSASSFRDDSVQYCTFYSVNQVKKKRSRSWLIHGHKQKQRGFVYNVIGQMRLCNSDITEDQKYEKVSCIIREAVLVDETEQVKGRKEVAAVVIKKKPEEKNFEAFTVIIPGGVHSYPEKGAPTPLVRRWRSGGLCDCGGWDVGCKLHVLSNKELLHELDHSFKLFAQEESEQDSGPVLAMTELKKGMYRVEFGSFLSHLQAFFVCVTVITCASEEEKTLSKTTTGRSSSSPFAPPLSPVGRV